MAYLVGGKYRGNEIKNTSLNVLLYLVGQMTVYVIKITL